MLGYANTAYKKGDNLEIDILTDYVETNPKVMQLIGKVEGSMPIALSLVGCICKYGLSKDKKKCRI